jgi:uncharacterized protein with PIN domain
MIDEGDSGFKFIADEMLGRLAKWLRAIGYDTVYHNGGGDSALVQRALEEDRIILTKDSHLIKRKLARKSFLVRSDQPREQLRQVVKELDLDVEGKLFTRCLVCNRELVSVRKEDVQSKVPSYTYLTQDRFYECPSCGRIYWPGTHRDSMLKVIEGC